VTETELTTGQAVVNFAAEFVGTVGAILAAILAFAAWSMGWTATLIGAVIVGLGCYVLQWNGVYGNDDHVLLRLLQGVGRAGPIASIAGLALGILTGTIGWIAFFTATLVLTGFLWLLLAKLDF
jgi:hypothetical protein